MRRRIQTLGLVGRFGIILVVVVVTQGILAYRFPVFTFFDLPLVCVIYFGLLLGNPIASILMGSSLGLLQDSLSGAVLGTNAFSKTLIGFLAASAGTKFAVDQPITRALALFLFSLSDSLLVTMLTLTVGTAPTASYGGAMGGWLLSATFNTLLGLTLLGYHDRYSDATT